MKNIIPFLLGFLSLSLNAQQAQFLDLPSFLDIEYEISGLTGDGNKLFLGAERCGKIFVVDQNNLTHLETIYLNSEVLRNGIEIEGLTIYNDFLLITDEKNGKIYSLNLKTQELRPIQINGKDLSSFKGKYGMEGIAADSESNLVYVLREKNEKFQSEIHSFQISEKEGALTLDYRNQTLIQHNNANWRYAGLTIDRKNKRLLCLKSYYIKKEPRLCKREIDYISFDALTEGIVAPLPLFSISRDVYLMRHSFATNVEGIYFNHNTIYITSDNGKGGTDCSQKSEKTALIKIQLND